MTGRQCAAARALLRMKRTALSQISGVGLSCIGDFENGLRTPREPQFSKIRSALVRHGVQFIGQRGVCLTETKP